MPNNNVVNQTVIELISILLSHYRNITTISKLQRAELDDFMFHCPSDIYAGFSNKQIPIVDVKNIISDYLGLINTTMNNISSDIVVARKNKDFNKLHRLTQTRSIIKCRYLNKRELSISEIEDKLDISRSHFSRYHMRALSVFAEYFLQYLHVKEYKGLSEDSDCIKVIISLSKIANKNIKEHCA